MQAQQLESENKFLNLYALDQGALLFELLVPCHEREDLDVTCSDRALVVRHRRYSTGSPATPNPARRSLMVGWDNRPFHFEVALAVPHEVVRCALKNGVLAIELKPKIAPRTTIAID